MRGPTRSAGLWHWLTLMVGAAALLQFSGCGQGTGPGPAANNGTAPPREGSSPVAVAARYDLGRDEERGGHTLKKHVGRTDEELRERLRKERNISAASTWTDRETAEVTVAEALRADRDRIEKWMRRGYPRANLALHYDAGRAIGRSLRRGEEQTVNCTSAVIVLRADGPDSFYVLTTYPEARE
ncbi:MAG: RNase A-like domain-containing protein [Candidatus Acidiferrum sp.]